MARVKRALNAKKKRKTVFKRAKGYYGAKSRSYRAAKEQVQHSLQYAYRDRRNKKRMIRRLGNHINTVLQSAFFAITGLMPAANPCMKTVFPTPRSPISAITSPGPAFSPIAYPTL